MAVPGVLFSQMQPPVAKDGVFNQWYNEEHVPDRLRLDGFAKAGRYRRVESDLIDNAGNALYAACYYVSDFDVFKSPEYLALREQKSPRTEEILSEVELFTRYIGYELETTHRPERRDQFLDSPYLYTVMFNVPADWEEEFNNWYGGEHLPMLLREPHWWAARRYRLTVSEPNEYTHLTIHYLGDLAALESNHRMDARSTPWRRRLGQQPWCKSSVSLYERLVIAW